jgi:hypothetical protein
VVENLVTNKVASNKIV